MDHSYQEKELCDSIICDSKSSSLNQGHANSAQKWYREVDHR